MDPYNHSTPISTKLLILDTGKFEQWKFRIQQYLQHEHYALWEVIEFSDSYKAPPEETAKDKGLVGKVSSSTKNNGNEATKKTKKNQLKQQYGNFKAKGSETLDQTFNRLQAIRNKDDLDTMSLDDVYNHLKVYEPDVQKRAGSNLQNLAFISSSNNNNGKSKVPTVQGASTASAQVSTVSTNVADAGLSYDTIDDDDIEEMDIKWNLAFLSMRADRFWKKTSKKITIQGSGVAGFEKSKVECFNFHKICHFARECRSPRSQDRGKRERESYKKDLKVKELAPKAMIAINGIGWDWSYMAEEDDASKNHAFMADEEEVPTEYALMAKSSSSSDNEVYDDSFCSKSCRKNTKNLNIKISKRNEELTDYEIDLYNYKRESMRDIKLKDNKIEYLRNELEEVRKEKESIDFKIENFKNASKDLDRLLRSQKLDKDMKGMGFNEYCAVSPPPAQVYSPPKKDLSWIGLPEFVDDTVTDYTRPTPSKDVSKSISKEQEERWKSNNPSFFEQRGSSGNVVTNPMIKFMKEFGCPNATKVNNTKNTRKPTVKYAEMYRNTSQREDLLDRHKCADKGSDSTDEISHVLGTLGVANILASGGLRLVFTTASTGISPTVVTASESFSTAIIFTTASVATPTTRVTRSSRGAIIGSSSLISTNIPSISKEDKGKRKMTEPEQPNPIIREQAKRDSEIARIHAKKELEMMIAELDMSNEMVSKYLTKDFKGMTFEKIEEKFILVWEKMQDFVPMNSKLESKRLKRPGIQFDKERFKKLKTAEALGTEPTQEQQSKEPKELSEEELKKMMELVPVEELHIEALHVKEDLDKLWSLVKETCSTTKVTDEKAKELWVEQKRPYEPDSRDPLWALQRTLWTIKEVLRLDLSKYLQHKHYALWEVIEFGDSYKALLEETTKDKGLVGEVSSSTKKKGRTMALTAEDMQKRKNDEAILKPFGGNEATKRTKKNQLKQQYGNFKAKGPETLEQTFNRNKDDLDTMSLDDVYYHLKVYKPEVQKRSGSNSQNLAFISSLNNNNRKSEVPTVQGASTASAQVSTVSTNVVDAGLSYDTVCAFIATQPNGSQIKYKDISQIDDDDIEEMDIKWNLALLSMRADRFWKKTDHQGVKTERRKSSKKDPKVEKPVPKAMIAIDGIRWDYSYMAKEDKTSKNHALVADEEEVPTEYALMAKSSSSSNNKGIPQDNINDKGYWDSGCSRYMTGNISYLSEYKPFNGGYVSFGHGRGKITGKGSIKTGKFDAKGDEGYFIGYSLSSKAFRERCIVVVENVERELTACGYVVGFEGCGTSSTNISGTKEDVHQAVKEKESPLRFIALPNWSHKAQMASSNAAASKDDAIPVNNAPQQEQQEVNGDKEVPESSGNSNPIVSTKVSTNDSLELALSSTVETEVPTVSTPVPSDSLSAPLITLSVHIIISRGGSSFPEPLSLGNAMSFENRLEDFFGDSSNAVSLNEVEADLSNMETPIQVSPTPTLRIHKDHPKSQIISFVDTHVQTRQKTKNMDEQSFIATIHQKTNPDLLQYCLFLCFLSQEEPKKIVNALKDPSWVEAMQQELLQFKIQNVWVLVDCPSGVRPIGKKWVLKKRKMKEALSLQIRHV
nr:hypothetical protein [Tanacetum cinerariifolium]